MLEYILVNILYIIGKMTAGGGHLINFTLSELILAQNDDGPLKWADGPYPIQIHANFQILMGHLKFLWALCKI